MSHFAAGNWPSSYGYIASISKTGFTERTTTGTGSTEGTDQLTATCPTAGLYNVRVCVVVRTASDAATSDALVIAATWTDDTGANSAINLPGFSSSDLKAAAGTFYVGSALVRVSAAGGTIKLALKDTVTGAKTVGALDWFATVEKISD